jgi:prophage regulatory protein
MQERLLRLPQVISITGLSKSTIYVLINDEDSGFPKPIKILGSRAIAFLESELNSWIDIRIKASREQNGFRDATRQYDFPKNM